MKPRQELRELRSIYDMIPKLDLPCIEGCADCCGPVMGTREEFRRAPKLLGYIEQLETFVDGNVVNWCATCPYVIPGNKGCAIYEDRPFLCRLFGATEEKGLRCPHGRGSSHPLTRNQTEKLMRRYHKLIDADASTKAMGLAATALWQEKAEKEGYGLD